MTPEKTLSPPAFPVPHLKGYGFKGLTKREYIAIAAMQALIPLAIPYAQVVQDAFKFADDMIERSQK